MAISNSEVAIILSASRRAALVLRESGAQENAHLSSHALDVAVGDRVELNTTGEKLVVSRRCEPTNVLMRSYFGQTRRIAANVDHLFIGAAVAPLFNTAFVDRIAAAAILEEIPFTLIVNKVDLGVESTRELVEMYQNIGFDMMLTSAIRGDGIDELRERLQDPSLGLAVIAGVSGVGKSTIVNSLIPDASARVNEVSVRTGQGRQTTSQPFGHLFPRGDIPPLILADLPGIQRFGTAHLDLPQIVYGFAEILKVAQNCPFRDCSHLDEEECAVKRAVEAEEISFSRYQSYIEMCAESIEAAGYD